MLWHSQASSACQSGESHAGHCECGWPSVYCGRAAKAVYKFRRSLQEMRMKMKMAMCLVLLGLLPVSPIYAHHGSHVSYDMEKPVVLKGTVTEFVWSNPHSQIFFDVKDEKGDAVNWGAETANPSALAKSGWTRNSLKPGDEVTVTVWPSKAHTPRGDRVSQRAGKDLDRRCPRVKETQG